MSQIGNPRNSSKNVIGNREFKTREKKVKSVKKWKPTGNGNQRVGKNGMKAYKIPHKLCDILLYLHVGAILIKN